MRLDADLRRRLSRAREELHRVDATPPIDVLAREAGLSRAHFIRVFESVFGATPHQLRIGARIERAKELLARDHAVTDVCFEVGFESPGSFSALFARRVGVPPSSFRRRVVQVPIELRRFDCYRMLGMLPADAFRTFREA